MAWHIWSRLTCPLVRTTCLIELQKKISYKEKCCPVGPTNLFTFLAIYRYIMRIHILNTVTTSVVDPKLFIPDPDPALNFSSSGSGSKQKFRIHVDPDPTCIN